MADTANRVEAKAPAFPASIAIGQSSKFGEYTSVTSAPGIDLRTYLAAKAMNAYLLRAFSREDCASMAVEAADALISALNAEQKGANP